MAEGAALVVGRFAARRGDRLGVVTFGAGREGVTGAKGGSRGMLGLPARHRHRTGEEGGGETSPPSGSSAPSGPRPAWSSSCPTSAARANTIPGRRWPGRQRSSRSRSSNPARGTLVDISGETLVDPKRVRRSGSTPAIHTENGTELLRQAIEMPANFRYRHHLFAGLFDYLWDHILHQTDEALLSMVRATWLGVIVTNVHSSNPVKGLMEHVMEWHLVSNKSDMVRLVRILSR